MTVGQLIEFPFEQRLEGRLRPPLGPSARERARIQDDIMRRAGHHVRLASIIAARGALDEQTAQAIAVHVSHYILSGQELPRGRAAPGDNR